MGVHASKESTLSSQLEKLKNDHKYLKFIIADAYFFFDDNEYMTKKDFQEIIKKWIKDYEPWE